MLTPLKIKIVFCGGGTGGHIMPIVAIARELKRLDKNNRLEIHYIGPKDRGAFEIFHQDNIKTHVIVSGKIRRYFSLLNIIDIFFSIPFGLLQSFFILLFINAKLVFSKGGTGSLVVALAAKYLGIPVFLHESDSVPGRSNRKVSLWAKKIFISFPITDFFNPKKTIFVGNPIRKDLFQLTVEREDGVAMFNLTYENPVLLVIGGSQGAKDLNEFILLSLNKLLKSYEIIHIAGPKNYARISIQSKFLVDPSLRRHYHLYGSMDENVMKNAYKISDIIISRSGSSSIFEIAASGKPSILIPLPTSAGNHQSKNAYQYEKTGAAITIEQNNLSENLFIQEIRNLILRGKEIKASALKFAKLDAAEKIAKEIINYLTIREIA